MSKIVARHHSNAFKRTEFDLSAEPDGSVKMSTSSAYVDVSCNMEPNVAEKLAAKLLLVADQARKNRPG